MIKGDAMPFDEAEYAHRLKRVRARMDDRDFDLLVVVEPANINYLTGYDAWSFYTPQAVLVPRDGELLLFTRGQDAPAALMTTRLERHQVVAFADDYVQQRERHAFDELARLIAARGYGSASIGLESDAYYFSPRAERALRAGLPRARFSDSHEQVNWVRAVKSSAELEAIRTAGRIVEHVMEIAIDAVEPGVRQCDAAAAISAAQVRGLDHVGGEYPAVVPLLPTGEGTATPHLTWSDRPFVHGEATILELAAVHRRYHCPLARTVFLGRPPAQLERLAEVVAEGTEAALAAVGPGVACEDVEAAWRTGIARHGYEKTSRIGYSIGIGYPPDWGEHTMSLRPGDKTPLERGMAFHMILGMWLETGGFELSESFHVTDTGAECFTSVPRQLFVKP
jgi:ectoine hydrolase